MEECIIVVKQFDIYISRLLLFLFDAILFLSVPNELMSINYNTVIILSFNYHLFLIALTVLVSCFVCGH